MTKTRRALLMLLALALLKWPVDAMLAAMLPDASVDPLPTCIAGALVSLLLLGLPAWHARPWTSPRLMQRRSLWEGIAVGVLAALLARTCFGPMDAAWQTWLGIVPDALPVPESLPMAMLLAVLLAVVPALTEEAFFRGALLTGVLDGAHRITAAAVATLAFTLMHGSAANLPSLLAVSLLMTLLMLHTGRIAVPMTAHLVYNLTALSGLALPDGAHLLGCATFGALCGYLLVRQPKMAHPPMKWQDGLIACAALAALAAQYFV